MLKYGAELLRAGQPASVINQLYGSLPSHPATGASGSVGYEIRRVQRSSIRAELQELRERRLTLAECRKRLPWWYGQVGAAAALFLFKGGR